MSTANVSLTHTDVTGEVRFEGAKISGELCCGEDTHLSNPPKDHADQKERKTVKALNCDRLVVAEVILSNTHIVGQASFLGAKISGELSCIEKTTLDHRNAIAALTCDGMSALRVTLDGTAVTGAVRLVGATISGVVQLQHKVKLCNPSNPPSNPGGAREALSCSRLTAGRVFLFDVAPVEGEVIFDGAKIRGNLALSRIDVQGAVSLLGTIIGGDLMIGGEVLEHSGPKLGKPAQLSNPGKTALNCQELTATNVFLQNTHVEGVVNMWTARISSDFYCRWGTQLHNPDCMALSAQGCRIDGKLHFRLAKDAVVGKVDLARARVGVLHDDLDSWPAGKKMINLEGFSYYLLDESDNEENQNNNNQKNQKELLVEKRLEWIKKSKPFAPDAYSQLAAVYKRLGEEGHARKVAIARERARREERDIGLGGQLWSYFLAGTVRYGYRPWLASIYFVLLLALGWVFFALPDAKEAMVPAPDTHGLSASAASKNCQNQPCFSPFFYTFDALVPFIDFHQESSAYWVPAADQRWGWGWGNAIMSWLLSVSGWILLAALAAGVGSLWRRE